VVTHEFRWSSNMTALTLLSAAWTAWICRITSIH
jgi:hypothetical protein